LLPDYTIRESVRAKHVRFRIIELPSIGQTWQIDWIQTDDAGISVEETDVFQLQVSGPIQDCGAWQAALKEWLIGQARRALIPWTNDLSQELGIPIQRVSIRWQKTRWGSYSSTGTVSLNAQLLLLPRSLVSYVLVHELCHAVHLNHSPKFWRLVRQWEPDADRRRSELKTAAWFVPSWLRNNF